MCHDREPVTADDVDTAATAAVDVLSRAIDSDWNVLAGDLEWTCRLTAEHLADDLIAYALQVVGGDQQSYVPVQVTVEASAESAGLLQAIGASAGLLSAAVRTSPGGRRAWHPYGLADGESFAAIGVVEILVHTYDLCEGFSLPWHPPPGMSDRVLRRLFPDAPGGEDEWPTLLWAAGRTGLGSRPRRTKWRWHNP